MAFYGTGVVHHATAPMRIDLTGGYIDVEPVLGMCGDVDIINAAIDQEVHVRGSRSPTNLSTVRVADSRGLLLDAPTRSAKCLARRKDIVGLIGRILETIGVEARLDIELDLPLGCGAGTSGSVTVAVTSCVLAIAGRTDVPSVSIPHFAATIERLAGHVGGLQDQLAAAVGGFRCHRIMACGVQSLELRTESGLFQGMQLAVPPHGRMGSQLVDLVIAEVRRDNHEVIGALRRLSALGSDLLAELSGPLADSARIESLILSVVSQQRRLHSQIDEAITQSPLWPFMLSRKCLAKPLGGAGFGAAWTVFPPVSDDVMAALAAAGWTAQSVEVVPYGVRSWKDA